MLIDGLVLTPASGDAAPASLGLVDRVMERHRVRTLMGDTLYTNFKPARWAYPLAQRGIRQGLPLGKSHHGTMDVKGATLFHGWLHCPSATIETFPSMPGPTASKEEWEKVTDEVDEFQQRFAFTRKESGLG
ncbi:hypothetical protein KIN34_14660 [Cellulomonas sp. DKR-3]|uniref:Transposase IS4-like domain-containing protein n=1 Tax=Cellulomonas fulva TaxID=2835530 RepID=A0ABS5U2B7_9CELL|nr:hypothetical protein [Cellulomonas fulva]MBT0995524.1 hypothetical protein [Cellulomonas fulva]